MEIGKIGTVATMKLESKFVSFSLLLLVTLSNFGHGFPAPPSMFLHRLSKSNDFYLTTTALWFNQTLDHFSPHDHRQFEQRYYEFLDYFRVPDGPIFLTLCGEYTCNGIPNDYLNVLAKKFGAAVVSLEHRYYGKSSPFKSMTTENLGYLSSKQALFDLAVFRQWYQESLNLKFNRTSVGESAGPECKAALQETTQLVEQGLASNNKELKTLFGATKLSIDGDFLFFLADAAATAFQYGNPDVLCIPLVEAKKAGQGLLAAYAKFVKEYYLGSSGVSVQTYDQKHLKETAVTEDSADRLWWFQVCTEVGFFQVAPANDSIRSSKVDTRYHLDLCKNVFGEGIYPHVDETNIYYGGTKIAGSRIIFTNGSQDPWRHASKKISSPDVPSYLITCHNCGHGTDLRGCPQDPVNPEGDEQHCSSPDAVRKVRQQIIEHIDLWLSECQESGRSYM
ncbi:hypothetical protein SLEP1_g12138 [Rubroshorea leprosula]|nr:hypothetical protein SLEP1_g12138 [Rubroshorea leprosula]